MEELNLKNLLPRVKAPEDFEERVFEKIRDRKKSRNKYLFISIRIWRRQRILLAMAFLVFLVAGIFLLPQFFKKYGEPEPGFSSAPAKLLPAESSILSLIEPVDFTRDFADIPAKKVVYILENVNESFISEVKY